MTAIAHPAAATPLPATADPQLDEWLSTATATVRGALETPLPAVRALLDSVLELARRYGDDGVTDANGAPVLTPTLLTDFSGDELALMLAAIDGQIKQAQAKTAKEGIEAARQRTEAANQEMADKIQESIDQRNEAAEKAKSQKVWGWLSKIAAVIGAIVAVVTAAAATVVSGASASPLLALAVIGLVAATVDLASQINQEINPGAESFTLGSLIGNAVVAQMDRDGTDGQGRAAAAGSMVVVAFLLMQPDLAGQMAETSALADGRSADFASGLRLGITIAAVITTVVAMIVSTVASGGASSSNVANTTGKTLREVSDDVMRELADVGEQVADAVLDSVDVISDVTRAAQKILANAKYVQAVNGAVMGVASVGQGITGVMAATDQRDAEQARADAKALEAVLLQLQAQSEEQMQRLKEIIAALDEGMSQFSQMIAAAGDQRANLVRHQVRA